MTIYNRDKQCYYCEKEDKDAIVNFLYKNFIGRMLLIGVARPNFSKLLAMYYDSKLSKNKVDKFIEKYNIDISNCKQKEFETFSSFFERRTYDKVDTNESHLISPVYGKIKAYKISHNLVVDIKDSPYMIDDIVKDVNLAKKYIGGTMLVIRLSLSDFHNFSFIDDGVIIKQYEIPGKLHSVRSISKKYKVYKHNKRTVTVMKTKNFGDVTQVEVGALLVGKIVNENKRAFKRGDNKGHFAYGGSTVVLFVNKNVKIDRDIIIQSLMGKECKVSLGDRIGVVEKC